MNFFIKKNYFRYAFVFFLCLIFFYREFLINYRMMLLDDYFAYYKYQHQIIYYETGDKKYQDYIPVNIRYFGNILQYLIFKIFPCVTLTKINFNQNLHPLFECATFSLALLNYILKYLIILCFYFYSRFELKKNFYESFVGSILTFIFLNYVEAFTLDRASIFYIIFVLIFLNKKYFCFFLSIFSFLVNEKVIAILGITFFLRFFFIDKNINTKNKYFYPLLGIFISLFFYFCLVYYVKLVLGYKFHPYYDFSGLDRLYLSLHSKSHWSNTIMPVFFCLFPYLLYFLTKNKLNNKFSKFEIVVPLFLFFLGIGGGENNIGRYVMHSFPLWLPLFSSQLVNFLKK